MKAIENKVEYIKIEKLKELPGNPRQISKDMFEKLKKSIADNPDYFEARPVIVSDRTGELVILAGNQRYKASKALKMTEIPCVALHGLSEEREREIIIRDNVENGEWDFDLLANEWDAEELAEWGVEEVKPFKDIIEDEPPALEEEAVSLVGEIYQLGCHRVFCGSFEDDEKVRGLFGGLKATCTFTDPPYNVNVKSRSTGKTIQNDKMAHEDFQTFLNRAFECVAANMATGGV